MSTMRAYMTGGGPLDGQTVNLPDGLTTYWIGSVQSAWATELGAAPENVVHSGLRCYKLASVRDDGTRVFEWVTPSGAH